MTIFSLFLFFKVQGQTTVTFDDQGWVDNQNVGTTVTVNGFTFSVTLGGSPATNGIVATTFNSNSGLGIAASGQDFTAGDILTITASGGGSFDFQSFHFGEFFANPLTVRGYRNSVEVASQAVNISGNGTATLGSSFDNVDEVRINSDSGNGLALTLDTFVFGPAVASNTPPTASSFTASNGPFENLVYTFSTSDFGYNDGDGDPLNNLLIESLPGAGTLFVDSNGNNVFDGGEVLSASSTVSKADLDAGRLKYVQNGAANTSFQFEVNDGTENSTGNYIATLNVTPVPTVTLAVSPTSRSESLTTANVVTATLSNAYGANTTVNLTFSGTATGSNVDYSVSGTSITIPSGNTSGTITITNVPDILYEGDETVVIDIGSVTNGVESGTQQVTYTIIDDDPLPTVSLEVLDIYNPITDESGGQAYVRANLAAVAGVTVTVPLSFSGTAMGGGTDYSVTGTSITISPGEIRDSIRITSQFDGIVEGDETIIISMGTPTNAIKGTPDQVTVTIKDEDVATEISINDPSVNEGNSGTTTLTFTVSLSEAAPVGGATVDYATSDGTAVAGSDYTAVSGTLSFAVGETSKTIDVPVSGDQTVEVDETLTLTLSNPTGIGIAIADGTGTGTITNDDQASVTIANVSGNEDDGPITVTVTLDNAVDGGFDVDVSTADGTATVADNDYPAVINQTLSFAGTAGEQETFTITPTADATPEPNETVIISMSNLVPAVVSSSNIDITDGATLTILSDDDISISINDPSVAEGDAGSTSLTFTISLSDPAPSGGATVDYATADGTAVAGSDYTAVSGTLSFAVGESSKTIDVPVSGDQLVEPDETFTLTLSNPTGTRIVIADGTGTGTITNDDFAPSGYSVSWDDLIISASEASNTSFTISNAEIGTTAVYSISSSGDGNTATVTGSTSIVSTTQSVSVNVSSLTDGVLTVSIALTDGGGNTGATATDNSATLDQTPPVPDLSDLPDINVQCVLTNLTPPTATDNLSGAVTGTNNVSLPITTQGTTVVTWTYDDGNGNTSTQNQNVIIDDTTPPVPDVLSLPNITAQCQVTSLTPPTATDNCAGTVTVTNNATLPITTQGTTVITWSYNDGNGNITFQNQNVIIDDTTPPTPDVIGLPTITAQCEVTSLTPPTGTDNCGGPLTITSNATLPITTQGTTVITWAYDDGNGNISFQNQNIVIEDTQDPIISAKSAISLNVDAFGTVELLPSMVDEGSTDNCGIQSQTFSQSVFDRNDEGVNSIQYIVEDAAGNTSEVTINVTIVVVPKVLTVTADPGQSKLFGTADPVFTFTATGFEGTDDETIFTGALSRDGGETVGTYAINQGTLDAGPNYTINFVPADFEIKKGILQITGSFSAINKVYDGTRSASFIIASLNLVGIDASAPNVFINDITTEFVDKNVGVGKEVRITSVNLGGANAASYEIDYSGSPTSTATISAASLSVSGLTANNKVYDGTTLASLSGTPSVTGIGSDDVSVIGTSVANFTQSNVGMAIPVTVTGLSLDGADKDNYEIIQPAGLEADITQATLSITANPNQSKVFGSPDPVFSYTASGFIGAEDETILTGALTRSPGEDIGIYSILQGDLSAGDNYTIDFTGADFTIAEKTLTITVDAGQSKIYGEADPMYTYQASGFENGDDESILTGALARTAGENVGTYPINLGSLDAGSNYTINYIGADFTITEKTLDITVDAGQDKIYGEADPVFTYQANGFENADDEGILTGALARIAGENVGVYAINLGTLNAGDNYTINFTGANFEITPRTLNVSANPDQAKEFGQTDPVFLFAASNFGNGDNQSIFTGALSRAPGENVGSYPITIGSLSAGSNYLINFTSANFVIAEKVLTITANAGQSKVFGQADPVFTFTATGFAGGDDENILTGSLSRVAGENVGTYPLQLGSLSAGSNYTINFIPSNFAITRATITGITFTGGSFVFDGSAKSLAITGTLPTGTSVAYTNNGRTDVGTQEVTATITGSNYNTLVLTADLTITPADITGITFEDGNFVFDGTEKSIEISGTLPAGTSVTYSDNTRTDVGTQEVTATITGSNYNTLVLTADLTITPADIAGITFEDGSFVFDGTEKSIEISGILPAGTSVTYSDNTRTDVGTQEVTATITGSNYNTLVLTADLTITPADITGITFEDGNFVFDGTEKSIEISGTLPAGTSVTYSDNTRTDVGTQEVMATIRGSNYNTLVLTADLTITPADITGITFEDGSFVFDGVEKSIFILGTTPEGTSVTYSNNMRTDAGTQEATATITGSNFNELVLTADLTITPAELMVIADEGQSKLFGESDPELTFTATGYGEGDDESIFTGSLSRGEGEAVGFYPITLGNLDAGQNYTINFTGADFEIITNDSDGDGVPDEVELEDGTDPNDPDDFKDSDGDGVPDKVEEDAGTDPNDSSDYPDIDEDGVPDYVEDRDGTDPNNGSDFLDSDGDGVPDYVQDRSIVEFVSQSVTVAWGTAADDVPLADEVVGITGLGEFINLPVSWSLTGFNPLIVSTNNFRGTVTLPEGLFNPYELDPVVSITVEPKPAPQDLNLSENSFIAIPDVFFQEIGFFTVIDPSDDVHEISLIDGALDNAYFEIIDGILFWSSAEQVSGRTQFRIRVRVTDRAGNILDKEFQIERQRTPLDQLDIPNTFTPNNDGVNDTWGVPALRYYEGVQIQIIEVGSGNRVFYTEDPDVRWDGRVNGRDPVVTSYVWVITVVETGEVRRGMLNLLKQ
ncbi:MBG domain-containing protein [Algoriphagus sp. NF]|nr:MBG domain-containing protein [Algoriphagus sp. NF]